ncbi:MAG: hypothetical protein NXH88_05145 [Hyphomonas sp.]|nr:hypothetical protein [Hyphomonas sp.]
MPKSKAGPTAVEQQAMLEAIQRQFGDKNPKELYTRFMEARAKQRGGPSGSGPYQLGSAERQYRRLKRLKVGRDTLQTFLDLLSTSNQQYFRFRLGQLDNNEAIAVAINKRVAGGLQAAKAIHPQVGADELTPVLGPVATVRDFLGSRTGSLEQSGIPVEEISIEQSGEYFEPPREISDPRVVISGDDNTKFMLKQIPPDLIDHGQRDVRMDVFRLRFSTIRRSDPYFYQLNEERQKFPDRYGDVVENRKKYFRTKPNESQIPYSLTLFFFIRLLDGNYLYMKRSSDVSWYPNAFDFSGGEGLAVSDFDQGSSYVMRRWLKRAIIEEYFPSRNVPQMRNDQSYEKFYSFSRLAAIGLNTLDASFPILALVQSKMTLNEFKQEWADVCREYPRGKPDSEGTRGVLTEHALRDLVEKGECLGTPLWTILGRGDDGELTADHLEPTENAHRIVMSMKASGPNEPYLHPMACFEIYHMLEAQRLSEG